jgi:hypothetical protein
LFKINLINKCDGVSDDISLENVAAPARVDPLVSERGFDPARVASLAGFATLSFFAGAARPRRVPLYDIGIASGMRACNEEVETEARFSPLSTSSHYSD